jgi:hypothetical protein
MTQYTEKTISVLDIEYSYIEAINDDGTISSIPKVESNSDYQAYLRWLNGEEENGTIS